MTNIDTPLAREAKAIVALAFRNGPLEDLHLGKSCSICRGKPEYSHITRPEMKELSKNAVSHVYKLLWLKGHKPQEYQREIAFGEKYTGSWDDPHPFAQSSNPNN